MSIVRIEDRQLDPDTLARLTRNGPVLVIHDGVPLFIAHRPTPEWLEMIGAEEELPGDMRLDDCARLYNIRIDREAYLRDAPDDAPYTVESPED